MKFDDARQFALSLPEVTEAPHFDFGSWRVGGKIIATIPPGGELLHIFIDEGEVRACIAENPAAYEELWWGKRLLGLRVTLATADLQEVCELLETAWRKRAPKRLLAAGVDGEVAARSPNARDAAA